MRYRIALVCAFLFVSFSSHAESLMSIQRPFRESIESSRAQKTQADQELVDKKTEKVYSLLKSEEAAEFNSDNKKELNEHTEEHIERMFKNR